MITLRSREFYLASFALAFSSFLVFCNLYSAQPILADFAKKYQVSITIANWIFAGASLGLSLSLIPWALFADRFGRRLMMMISLGITAIIGIILYFVDSVSAWIFFRVAQGVALGGLPAVAVAYISEEFEPRSIASVVGSYIAANSLGGISGRLLGGFLADHFGLNMPMLFCGFLAVIGVFLIIYCLPKEQHFQLQALQFDNLRKNLCGHIRNPKLWRTYFIGGLGFGVFINLYSVVSLRLINAPYDFSTTQVSLLFLCYLSGTFAASLTGKLTQRYSALRGMFLGWCVLLIGVVCLMVSSLPLIIMALLICSIGFFTTHALASGWVGKQAQQARALASALYLSFYYFGSSMVGFYLIFLWRHYSWASVILGSIVLLSFIPVCIWGMRKSKS
ncbi:MFS transporter [Gallibacterium genomosp. 3]|uniref:Bicyclomycin/multidrug efflux system protein n=1 Tax=Gallibacterium genomosp. 3 TaxID=505345 RepID=A0A1A7PWZ5_9PAST|nr:MFS transporter [Gallibacterium genomosp. 3]OBX06242.1 bicyclomycin/multidrug efflux system protein [Gallibacterium genomosp. 3]